MMPYEQRLAAVAAGALFMTLFLPWYQETVIASGTKALQSASATLTGWGAFSWVEAAVLLVAIGVLVLVFQRAEGRAFHLPGGDGGVITAAGVWTGVLVVWRMFDKQGTTSHGQYATAYGVEWGIFVALGVAVFLAYSGSRIRAARRPEPALPGEDAPPPAPAFAAASPSGQPAAPPARGASAWRAAQPARAEQQLDDPSARSEPLVRWPRPVWGDEAPTARIDESPRRRRRAQRAGLTWAALDDDSAPATRRSQAKDAEPPYVTRPSPARGQDSARAGRPSPAGEQDSARAGRPSPAGQLDFAGATQPWPADDQDRTRVTQPLPARDDAPPTTVPDLGPQPVSAGKVPAAYPVPPGWTGDPPTYRVRRGRAGDGSNTPAGLPSTPAAGPNRAEHLDRHLTVPLEDDEGY
jgi:hypothetical protein